MHVHVQEVDERERRQTHLSGANQLGQIHGRYLQEMTSDGRQLAPYHLDVGVTAVGHHKPAEDDHRGTQEAPHDVPQDPGTQ